MEPTVMPAKNEPISKITKIRKDYYKLNYVIENVLMITYVKILN